MSPFSYKNKAFKPKLATESMTSNLKRLFLKHLKLEYNINEIKENSVSDTFSRRFPIQSGKRIL